MTVHGTARFAGWDEVRAAGLLPGTRGDGLLVGWWYEDRYDFEAIRYGGDLHQFIVGGTGGGKFTTALAPLLLGSGLEEQTVVVVDPKGEIARLAGPYFAEPFGEQANVHLLDPWDQCGTGQTASVNVLAEITLENPSYVDDARALADAMIIPSGGENTHWDNTARNFLTAILLYVALDPLEKNRRSLIRVRELVTLPWSMPKTYKGPKRQTLQALLYSLLDSDLAGGAIKRGFGSLLNREEKERSGIISSIDRDTAWIDSPQMAKVVEGESLDLRQAGLSGHKYFIVLPPDYFMTHRAWLRLMVTAFAKAFKRARPDPHKPQHERWRHIVIDEFANLGEMSFMLNDVAVARGFDVKYHFAVQDLTQLRRVYEDGWESFINNSFQRFFAVGDLFTAEYVSRLLGTATVQSEGFSAGTSGGESVTFTESETRGDSASLGIGTRPSTQSMNRGTSVSRATSQTSGWSQTRSVTQVQRPLLTPDEVRRLPQGDQLLFFRGMHPIRSWRPPYWTVFPSLPKFTLQEVLGTFGRPPKDEQEKAYFTAWRDGPRLMRPERRPALSEPAYLPGPAARRKRWPLAAAAVVAAGLIVALAWLFWPSHDYSKDLEDEVSQRAAAQRDLLAGLSAIATEMAQPVGTKIGASAVEEFNAQAARIVTAAKDRLRSLSYPAESLDSARAEIERALANQNGRWAQAIRDAAMRGAADGAARILEGARARLEEAARLATEAARETAMADARKVLSGAPHGDQEALAHQLAIKVTRAMIEARDAASAQVARLLLSERAVEMETAARTTASEAVRTALTAAQRETDSLIGEIMKREEERKMRAAAARQAELMQKGAQDADDEARRRMDALRAQVRAQGFNLCENTDVNGTSLRLDQHVVPSVEECAARCRLIAGCDGFRANPDSKGFYCLPFANTVSKGPFKGIMSGKRSSC